MIRAALVMALTLACTGVAHALPRDASSEGYRIDQLMWFANIAIGVLALVGIGWLVIATVLGRKRNAASNDGSSLKERLVPLGAAALLLLGVDTYLLVQSTADVGDAFGAWDEAASEADAIRVQINARQWSWDTRQTGQDGQFGTDDDVYLQNELVVPIGQNVVIQLASADVVHALYIPNMRIKLDAIPGRVNKAWFQPTETGEFDMACSQHCGVNHYLMAATLRVLEKEEFAAWLKMASNEAKKINTARGDMAKEQSETRPPAIFPEFAAEPNVSPGLWGWVWEDGRK